MGTNLIFTNRFKSAALVGLATVALGASLALATVGTAEESPNHPVFPPREKIAFADN